MRDPLGEGNLRAMPNAFPALEARWKRKFDCGATLPAEQALALADESSPFFLCGAFQGFTSLVRDEPKIREAFASGAGVGWHEHSHDLFEGTERFFRTGYNAHLVAEWIPALDGVEAKLRAGIRVADVGCGLGASTILMAKSFPASEFVGFDYHKESIEAARLRAADAGVGDRVRFEVAPASGFRGTYDFVTMFDCLQTWATRWARHATRSLRSRTMARG